jgi:hypothetical protein
MYLIEVAVARKRRRRPATEFVIRLRARPGTNGIHALRAVLKNARRRGLRCTSAREARE